eukprot:jgi/Hompol1/1572/HPOL_005641-RA
MLARKRLLGEYSLGKTIGQGAFSKVKIATHRETGEKVAIKVIDKKLMEEKAKKSKAAHEERERKRLAEEQRKERAEGRQSNQSHHTKPPPSPVSATSNVPTPTTPTPPTTDFGNIVARNVSGASHSATDPSPQTPISSASPTSVITPTDFAHSPVANSAPTQTTPTKPESNPSFISNMQKEVQLMMRLDHPNIIKIYQVLETEEECFVVMEYAKGGELIDYIAARDYLTEKEARRIFRQIISALDHCHLANVVHRDLKLENLLLNQDRNVLISDFGLGRTFNPDVQEYMKTFCGTPNYAAVELISGIPYLGVKSDIWAMGVVLYIMMTGHPPFVGETISLLYRSIKAIDYKIPNYFSP